MMHPCQCFVNNNIPKKFYLANLVYFIIVNRNEWCLTYIFVFIIK